MNERREELRGAYGAVVGKRLIDFAWRPLTCDTPYVIENRAEACLRFTGAVQLWFEEDVEVFLSWAQYAPSTLIATTEADRWMPRALDRIMTIHEPPWWDIVNATLVAVDLFVCTYELDGEVPLRTSPVAARHWLQASSETHRWWVGTGDERGLDEGDDLWVAKNQDPSGWEQLELLETIGA
jgi:hypothetical protein